MPNPSTGLITGGSIGGGIPIDTAVLKDINLSFENLQKSKNLGTATDATPIGVISRLANAMKGMKDTMSLSSLTLDTTLSPPTTPIGAGVKVPGMMSRRT